MLQPDCDDCDDKSEDTATGFVIVTSLRKHIGDSLMSKAAYTCIAEHTVPENQVSTVKAACSGARAKISLSPDLI